MDDSKTEEPEKEKQPSLKTKRKQKLASLAQALQAGDSKKAEKEIIWLQQYQKFRELHSSFQSKNRWFPAIIGIVCLLTLAITLQPVSSSMVKMNIKTAGLTVSLHEGWTPNVVFHPKSMFLNSIEKLSLGQISVEGGDDGETYLQAGGQSFGLQFDPIGEGGKFSIEKLNDELFFSLDDTPLYCQLDVKEGRVELFEPYWDTLVSETIPLTFLLKSNPNSAPIELILEDTNSYQLQSINCRNIHFLRQIKSGLFVSNIQSGAIKILSTGETYELSKGEELSIYPSEPFPIQFIDIDSSGIQLQMELQADEILSGTKGFQRSLKPTWLLYFNKDTGFKYIWVVIGWIWTLIWSFKKTVF